MEMADRCLPAKYAAAIRRQPGQGKTGGRTDLQSLTSDSQAVRGVVLAPAAAGEQMQSDFASQAEVSIDVVMRK